MHYIFVSKTPPMTVKVPDWYKPNNIPYMQTGPNTYVRTGPMPGSVQAGVVQGAKDTTNEVFGHVLSDFGADAYEQYKSHKAP